MVCAVAAMSDTNIPAGMKFILSNYFVILTIPFIPLLTHLSLYPLLYPSPPYVIFLRTDDAEVPSILQGRSRAKQKGVGREERRENDKHEHGGSWGQLKIALRRGGESE